MELERLRKLIQSTESFKANPACQKLAERFEEFLELYHLQKEGVADEETFKRFEKCLNEFWAAFNDAAASLGVNPDMIKENLNNPDFFTKEHWASAQALQKEVMGEESYVPKKPRKINQNVRI